MDLFEAALELYITQSLVRTDGDTEKVFHDVLHRLERQSCEHHMFPAEECGPLLDFEESITQSECGEYDQHQFFIPAPSPQPEEWGLFVNLYFNQELDTIFHFNWGNQTIQ